MSVLDRSDWLKDLSWRCNVCGDERPDDKISVFAKKTVLDNGIECQLNIRYCNDRQACIDGAPNLDFPKRRIV